MLFPALFPKFTLDSDKICGGKGEGAFLLLLIFFICIYLTDTFACTLLFCPSFLSGYCFHLTHLSLRQLSVCEASVEMY